MLSIPICDAETSNRQHPPEHLICNREMKKRIALGAGLLALLLWTSLLYTKVMPDESPSTPATPQAPEPPAVTNVPTKGAPTEPVQLPAAEAERRPEPAPEAPAVAEPPMPASGDFEEMQRTFESESRDAAWASREEAAIPPLLAEVGFPDDALDGEVSCHRTLCRFPLRIVENDALALMKLAGKVDMTKVGLSYGAAEVAGDKTRIIVYLSRRSAPAEPTQ